MGHPKMSVEEKAQAAAAKDTRRPIRAAEVAAAVVVGAVAMAPELAPSTQHAGPRWNPHEAFGPLRAAFHALPDAVRREAIARLLCEEAGRLANERDLAWQAHGPASRSKGDA